MNEWMLGAIAVGAIVIMLGGGSFLWRVATHFARNSSKALVAAAVEAVTKKAKAV